MPVVSAKLPYLVVRINRRRRPWTRSIARSRASLLPHLSKADRHLDQGRARANIVACQRHLLECGQLMFKVRRWRRWFHSQNARKTSWRHICRIVPQLLVQLLSWTRTHDLDLDVVAGPKTRHLNQALGEAGDLNRITHVKHIDFAIGPERGRLQH